MGYIAANHETLDDEEGKFKPPVQLSFFQMNFVEKACGELIKTLGKSEKERKQKGEQADIMKEVGIGKDEKFSYKPERRDWHVPETTGEDTRAGDARYVSGGA